MQGADQRSHPAAGVLACAELGLGVAEDLGVEVALPLGQGVRQDGQRLGEGPAGLGRAAGVELDQGPALQGVREHMLERAAGGDPGASGLLRLARDGQGLVPGAGPLEGAAWARSPLTRSISL